MSTAPQERADAERVARFDSIDELENYLSWFGLSEGKPKTVISGACFGSADSENPRWEIHEPVETLSSVSSLLWAAGELNKGSDAKSEELMLGLSFSLKDGATAQVLYAVEADLPYIVTIKPRPADQED